MNDLTDRSYMIKNELKKLNQTLIRQSANILICTEGYYDKVRKEFFDDAMG